MNRTLEQHSTGRPRFKINRPSVLDRLARSNTTIDALAAEAHIDSSYLSSILAGRHCPRARTRAKLMATTALAGMGFDDLFVRVGGAD